MALGPAAVEADRQWRAVTLLGWRVGRQIAASDSARVREAAFQLSELLAIPRRQRSGVDRSIGRRADTACKRPRGRRRPAAPSLRIDSPTASAAFEGRAGQSRAVRPI